MLVTCRKGQQNYINNLFIISSSIFNYLKQLTLQNFACCELFLSMLQLYGTDRSKHRKQ